MNYGIWLQELAKYKTIIDMTKHILFEREAGRKIDHLLPNLNKLIDECEFTTMKIGGNGGRPLAGAESMFNTGLNEKLINDAIKAAEYFWKNLLSEVQKAASGKYTHALKDFTDEADVYSQFQSMGAKVGVDFLILGLTVHLFDVNPTLFTTLQAWLKANK